MTQSGRIRRPEEESRLALPVIGKVKVGYKDERGFPKSVDYFIPAGRYESYFTKVFGEKPKVIQVVFTDDDPRKVCMERYEYRDDEGKLIASGDGENFSVWDGKNYIPMSINEHPNLMRGITKKYPNRLSKKRAKPDGVLYLQSHLSSRPLRELPVFGSYLQKKVHPLFHKYETSLMS